MPVACVRGQTGACPAETGVSERVILATAAMNSWDKACYDSGMFAFDITLVILSEH
jgi:hypothetical protein